MSYVKNIPNQKCWVIYTQAYYTTDHGYPEDGTERVEYTAVNFYTDKEAWLKAIHELECPAYGSKVTYKAGEFDPVNISVKTTVEITPF